MANISNVNVEVNADKKKEIIKDGLDRLNLVGNHNLVTDLCILVLELANIETNDCSDEIVAISNDCYGEIDHLIDLISTGNVEDIYHYVMEL